jgi:DNA mismatch endonuclease, patch repair protein
MSNVAYWTKKIRRNRARDAEVGELLAELGWTVVRVWEHELKSPTRIVAKVNAALLRSKY